MTTEAQEIKVPDLDETIAYLSENRIVFGKVFYDEWPHNPLNVYNYGEIYSLSHRHNNYNVEAFFDAHKNNSNAVLLSYSEHGLCRWFKAGTGHLDRWDSVAVAGIWVPSEDALQRKASFNDEDDWNNFIAQVLEEYTDWCNGNVYAFKTEVFELRCDDQGEPIDKRDYYDDKEELSGDNYPKGDYYGYDLEANGLNSAYQETVKDLFDNKQ